METNKILLEVDKLCMEFPVSGGLLKAKQAVHAVDGVSFRVREGKTLGIVGESGCGKSTIGNLIVRLLRPTGGRILFDGQNITDMNEKEFRLLRRQIQMVFQDPFSSLDPRMTAFNTIAEPYRIQTDMSRKEIRKNVEEMMELVGLDKSYLDRYPHEFSGGQRQRLGIARALALHPKLIICDEPVSALDVSIQAQILNLLKSLQKELNLTYIFIAHGLPAVQFVSDDVAVMYLGKMIEISPTSDLFAHTLHPYTEGLLSAIPVPDPALRDVSDRPVLEGELPSPLHLPEGCRFCSRCKYADERCHREQPELREVLPEHFVACHYPLNLQGGNTV